MNRILNVLYEERLGGPQLRVLQVARGLKVHGYETIVALPKGDPPFAQLLAQHGISFRELNLVRPRRSFDPRLHARFALRFWSNVAELRQMIRNERIEIVHTNGLANLQAALAARREGVALVWHLNDVFTPKLLRAALLPLVRRWAAALAQQMPNGVDGVAVGMPHDWPTRYPDLFARTVDGWLTDSALPTEIAPPNSSR